MHRLRLPVVAACLLLVTVSGMPGPARAVFQVSLGFRAPVSAYCRAIVTEAFRRLGRWAEVRELPAERSIRLANEGFNDADCMRIKGIDRLYPDLVQVPEKIFDVRFYAFSRGDIRLEGGWQGLKPYNVATVYGWKLAEIKIAEVAPKSFLKVDTAEALFRMLDLGRIDVAVIGLLDGSVKLRRMGLWGRIKPVHPALATRELYFSMHRRHAGLREPLARAFREMKEDGTWKEIEDRTLGPLLSGFDLVRDP